MPDEIERWAVEPLHRARRGVDERLLLALPWLGRLVVSAAVRPPAGSRPRRAVITYSLRTAIAATNRGDYWAISAFCAPNLELCLWPDEPEARPAGLDPAHYGPEGYAKAVEIWTAAFSDHRWDLYEFVDPGGNRIGARAEMVGRGAGSGLEVRWTQFHVWQFDRGLLRRQWVFASEEAMLALLNGAQGLGRSHPLPP